MLEPVGNKTKETRLDDIENLKCPTDDAPYFFTHKNTEIFLRTGKQWNELSNDVNS